MAFASFPFLFIQQLLWVFFFVVISSSKVIIAFCPGLDSITLVRKINNNLTARGIPSEGLKKLRTGMIPMQVTVFFHTFLMITTLD
jgi:hypothetical protein